MYFIVGQAAQLNQGRNFLLPVLHPVKGEALWERITHSSPAAWTKGW